jgi:hypothetical protein
VSGDLDRWINTGDLDELLREVDRLCDAGDWDGLVVLRDRARGATERGHQLWPAASYAEYRLALSAPGAWAASVVADGGYLAPGPLTEVAAQGHRWDELSDGLAPGPARAQVAQERVLRGEDLTGAVPTRGTPDAELPLRLMAWEPGYALAEYRADSARFPAPAIALPRSPLPGSPRAACADGADGARALEEVVRHWAAHSEGRVRAVAVAGSAGDAVATLGVGPARATEVSLADAVALMAWSAASGGARGRRRGAATGRFEAWWALAVLTLTEEDWPIDPGPPAEELRWWVWAPDVPMVGWVCRIAVEDASDGLAWALDATDRG